MTNKTISVPETDWENRALTMHLSGRNAPDRAKIEQFIHGIFYQVCGAKVRFFLPTLISLRDQGGRIVAACGIRSAGVERLFLENYMDKPVEQALSEKTGSSVMRSDIVEIGNFSVAETGMARALISAIFDQLHATSKQWAVFTTVQILYNSMVKQNIFPTILCNADIECLPLSERSEWGSYYQQNPQVMAVQRMERRDKNRADSH